MTALLYYHPFQFMSILFLKLFSNFFLLLFPPVPLTFSLPFLLSFSPLLLSSFCSVFMVTACLIQNLRGSCRVRGLIWRKQYDGNQIFHTRLSAAMHSQCYIKYYGNKIEDGKESVYCTGTCHIQHYSAYEAAQYYA